jgi:ribosome-associated translation inhibitor RaiA
MKAIVNFVSMKRSQRLEDYIREKLYVISGKVSQMDPPKYEVWLEKEDQQRGATSYRAGIKAARRKGRDLFVQKISDDPFIATKLATEAVAKTLRRQKTFETQHTRGLADPRELGRAPF